jgi:hypothetical protein
MSIKELERLHYADKQAKHPDIKPSYLPKTTFRDDSANGLTKCIVAWLQLHGYFAGRDKPRPEQLRAKREIEHAGGIYIFVHSFDEFLEQIKIISLS